MTDRLQLQVVLDAVERITGPLRNIRTGSAQTGAGIVDLRGKLRDLQEQQNAIASFRGLKEKLGNDAQAMDAARQRAAMVSAELASQQQRLQPLQAAYETSAARVERLADAQAQLAITLKSGRAEQAAAAAAHEKTAHKIRELQQELLTAPAGQGRPIADEIARLQAAQRNNLDVLRRLDGANKVLRKEQLAGASALKHVRSETREHERALRAAQLPVEKLQREMKNATSEAGRLKAAHAAGGQELQRLRARLAEAGIKTSDLSRHERELRGSVTQANAALDQQKRKLAEVAKQQRQMAEARERLAKTQQLAGSAAAAGAGAAGVAYATSRPLGAVTRAFMPAEDASMQLRASMMGANGQVSAEFKEIDRLAKRLGDRLPGTTADFIEMMTMLRRQGLSAKSILGGTGEAAAYLGVQLKMPATEAAEFAAKMQDSTRTAEKDMMGLMDTIQRTFYLGVDPQNMLAGFRSLGPVMGLIRKEGVEGANALSPLLTMLDQASLEGEAAGNALRKIFQGGINLKKVGKANSLLQSYGVETRFDFTDGKGNFGSIENVFEQIAKLKNLTDTQRLAVIKEIFGDDSETNTALETMMAKGVDGYREVAAKMQAQADLRTRVNEQLTTLTNVTEAAQGSFTNALSEIGVAVAPQLKTMIQWLGEQASAFGAWVRENPKLAATVFWVAGAVAAVSAVVAGLALTVAAVLGPMAMMRFALTTLGIKGGVLRLVIGGIGRAAMMAAGPLRALGWVAGGATNLLRTLIGLNYAGLARSILLIGGNVLRMGAAFMANPIVAAVMAIAVLALLVIRYWEPIKGFFIGLWNDAKAAFSGGLTGILGLLANFSPLSILYSAFAGVMRYLGIDMPASFTGFGGMLVNGLINGITGAAKGLWDAVANMAAGVRDRFKIQLGIKSPSRVFAALGDDTMAGLRVGLERSGGGPLAAVQQVAQQVGRAGQRTLPALGLAAATMALPVAAQQPVIDRRPPLAAAASPARGAPQITVQGDTIHLTVQAPPGADLRQLQQMIERALNDRERNKAARLRTALTDRE